MKRKTKILPRKCPQCGAELKPDAPEGLCPACLLQRGIATEGAPPPGQRGFVPPPVAEIARLFPQLEILGLIGKGGMGAVYKARQPALDRFVALKILPPAVAGDSGFAERFNREARALARLNHPNIVGIYDFGSVGQASRLSPSEPPNARSEAGGPPVPLWYLLMEFVDGTNLREIEAAGKLSPEQALAIVPQICEALQFAHNEGIVHRDIKPENLLLDKKGRVKITDFGIAKIVGAPAGRVTLTGARDVVGTPHYMAPEQIEKPQTVDHRADIYSLGVVFYEMLTGELPLGKFAPPSRKVEVDVRLDEVVLHALEKEPARRYQQASQVKTDVETIAGTPPAVAGFAAQPIAQPPTFPVSTGLIASDKAILPAFLLAFFFGIFGAHRFYVGKVWTGLLQVAAWAWCIFLIIVCASSRGGVQDAFGILLGFSILGCLVWAAIDWILILCKAFTDGRGRRLTCWFHPPPGEFKTGAGATAALPPTPPAGATPPASPAPPPPPPAPGTPPLANSAMIVAPAVALMVAAGWKLLRAFTALFFLSGHSFIPWLGPFLENLGIGPIFRFASVSIVFFDVLPALLILFGAIQMLRLRSYAWSIAAGIVAIVACSLVSLPVGIWALIVLARPDVRHAFEMNRSPVPSAGIPPKANGAGKMVAMAVGLLLVLAVLVGGALLLYPAAPPETVPSASPTPSLSTVPALPPVPAMAPAPQLPPVPPLPLPASAQPVQPADNSGLPPTLPLNGAPKTPGKLTTTDEFQEDFSRTLPLTAQGRFSLDNVNGHIEIAGWDRNEVSIKALKHGRSADSVDAINIIVTASPGDVAVHTKVVPNATGSSSFWWWLFNGGRPNAATVDYAIQVPQNAQLKQISSVNGHIIIEDVSGDIKASTVNGEVQVTDAAANLNLSTVNGRIEAELGLLGGGQSVSLNTVNGQIAATLPANASADVSANTVNGSISSEFSALVIKKEFPLRRELHGTLGNGGARVSANTVNGGIHFRRGTEAR